MLPPKQSLALLELYCDEIKARIAELSPARVDHHFGDLLQGNLFTARIQSSLECTVGSSLADTIWTELTSSPMNHFLYSVVLRFLLEDSELHASMCVEAYEDKLSAGFRRLLNHCSELMGLLPAETLGAFAIELLRSADELGPIIRPVCDRLTGGEINAVRAKKLLFRSIPLFSMHGYHHLLFATSKCDIKARAFINNIHPGFFNEYDRLHSEELKKRGVWFMLPPYCDIASMLAQIQAGGESARGVPHFDARLAKIPDEHLRPLYTDTCKEKPINLRKYQRELTEEACNGNNVVICAPTGSGKTRVGAYIARQHIYSLIRAGKRPKVCFFVPTTTLVEQQAEVLKTYLGHCATVREISGNTTDHQSNPPRQSIDGCEVMVSTPQIIVNLLEEVCGEIEEAAYVPFSLTRFSLLIFDEAHHAKEKHPYNRILQVYHELKETGAFSPKTSLPQIVGMTASLGVGGATSTKRLKEAVKHTIRMCAHLDSTLISRVRNNLQELSEHSPMVTDETKEVPPSEFTSSALYRQLKEEMVHLEEQIASIPEVGRDDKLHKRLTFEGKDIDRLFPEYEQWVCELTKEVPTLQSAITNESRRLVMECLALLKALYLTVELLRLFGAAKAMEYLLKHMSSTYRQEEGCIDVVRHVWRMLNHCSTSAHGYESTLFLELTELIRLQLHNKVDSRVLIFTTRRDHCCIMAALLNEKLPSAKADCLIGLGPGTERGQSTSMQKKKLIDFHEGEIRVLCATSVAEEGLDVTGCNLVVQYESYTSEIAYIQRRGRGRAKEARFVLLSSKEGVLAQRKKHAICERLMGEALDVVDTQPKSWLATRVKKQQEKMRRARLRAIVQNEEKRANELYKYLVVCRLCSRYLTCSDRIVNACGMQYVSSDPDYWTRVEIRHIRLGSHTDLVGAHFCECRNKLGFVIISNGVKFPSINCKGITFLQVDKSYQAAQLPPNSEELVRKAVDKWMEVSRDIFTPRKIERREVIEMGQAMKIPCH